MKQLILLDHLNIPLLLLMLDFKRKSLTMFDRLKKAFAQVTAGTRIKALQEFRDAIGADF